MGRLHVLVVALFLLFETLFAGNTRSKSTPLGWVRMFACSDRDCRDNCRLETQRTVHFGRCAPVDGCQGLYRKYTCERWRASAVVSVWKNSYCRGHPYDVVRTDGCYHSRPYHSNSDSPSFHGRMCTINEGVQLPDERNYYKYQCAFIENGQELRYVSDDEKNDNVPMSTSIFVAVFLIVCMIGFIAGHLIHRNRKKTAENNVYMMQRKQKDSTIDNL